MVACGSGRSTSTSFQHVEVLCAGPRAWNNWRRENPGIAPDLNDLRVSISERQFGRVQGGPINLSRTELCRAWLDQATLIEANLLDAVLIDADLSDARLENADLRGANLCNANLAYASLNDARLEGASLCGADLRHARGLTQAQIHQALGDRRTALPANLTMPRAWLEGQSDIGQLVKKTEPRVDDQRANPYGPTSHVPMPPPAIQRPQLAPASTAASMDHEWCIRASHALSRL